MTSEHQNSNASSADTVVSQNHSEKAPVEIPASEQGHEQEEVTPQEKEPEEPDAATQPGDDALEKKPSGAPLDRTPSQAQRMGKKKITVVMVALCVRPPRTIR